MKSLKEVTGQIVSVVWHYCQRFSLRCWGKVFQWLPKDWHEKVSDFCKMKFVHVHFAADWMNKFPNRGRYQIANIINKVNNKISEQSNKGKVKTHKYINRQNQSTTGKLTEFSSQLSTLSVKVNNFNN